MEEKTEVKTRTWHIGHTGIVMGIVLTSIGVVIQYLWYESQPVIGPAENWCCTVAAPVTPWYVVMSSYLMAFGIVLVFIAGFYSIGRSDGRD